MGADTFSTWVSGKTAEEAFWAAVSQARYEHGHGGYTGTIAEKHEFVMIPIAEGVDPRAVARQMINDGDRRVDDKWGPAGCIDGGPDPNRPGMRRYLFFGWASS